MTGLSSTSAPGRLSQLERAVFGTMQPRTAIAYQIAIMLGILGAVALTIITMLQLGCRTFFNNQDQLV